jgi:hypothetical protein
MAERSKTKSAKRSFASKKEKDFHRLRISHEPVKILCVGVEIKN